MQHKIFSSTIGTVYILLLMQLYYSYSTTANAALLLVQYYSYCSSTTGTVLQQQSCRYLERYSIYILLTGSQGRNSSFAPVSNDYTTIKYSFQGQPLSRKKSLYIVGQLI